MEDHVVILGWDAFSERVLQELNRSGIPVAVATTESGDVVRDRYAGLEDVELLELESFEALGRLSEIDAARAARFFVNLETDEQKLLRVVDLAEREEWDGEIDVVLEDEQLEETFRDAGVRYAVARRDISSKLLATHVYEPDVAEVTEKLFTSTATGTVDSEGGSGTTARDRTPASRDLDLQEHRVGEEFELTRAEPDDSGGYAFGDVVRELRSELGVLPLAVYSDGELDRLPDPQTRVRPGDYLVVALARDDESAVRDLLGAEREGRLGEED